MLTINLSALEQLLQDFSGELESLAFDEVKNTPAYREVVARIRKLSENNPVVPFLYEGDESAVGHVITAENVCALKDYYDCIHERERIVLEKVFCYGVVLGSNLNSNGMEMTYRDET